ncbi:MULTISPECIES: VWA domain-containing protein [unclassified Beijerinckia]|uniref:VWA domain-containing protein n=1 Tax=unclassified Beijerinckia TaxID=2638183 RepID=UPI0008952CDE|nr:MULTISPECIES: VWA domain-containing protein [unclassified Beijerinckia]MDH7799855.1 Ca-activated chloride channel family protein [Beijerinckia sp. GAS462]SED39961.1 Ca-activated chloride channel family protein [Beijerinckia sp. 28-YEA-48]
MIEALSAFHFERPLWLFALPVALILVLIEHRIADSASRWRPIIDAELLRYLLVDNRATSRITPNAILLLGWTLAAIAVAGPAWQREPSPFADAQPPVVAVLKVTHSMMTEDLAPTRLDRARQKLSDLLALRESAATGLIAYAGSSHLVLPPTADNKVVLDLAKALEPAVMPKEGDDLADAVALAQRVLTGNGHGGSILIMADTVAGEQLSRLGDADGSKITILSLLPPNLDAVSILDAARALGATVVATTPDQADVTALARRLDRIGRISDAAGEGQHWQEAGYWLTPILALLVLLWFRRGWVLT